jgi:hypothetical protein
LKTRRGRPPASSVGKQRILASSALRAPAAGYLKVASPPRRSAWMPRREPRPLAGWVASHSTTVSVPL